MKMRYKDFVIIKGAEEFLDEKNNMVYDNDNKPIYCVMYASGIYNHIKLDDSVQFFKRQEGWWSDRAEYYPCSKETFLSELQACVDEDIKDIIAFHEKMKDLAEGKEN